MRGKRTYQAPLVLTVAALASTACNRSDPTPAVGGGTADGNGRTGRTGTTRAANATGGRATAPGDGARRELPACDTSQFGALPIRKAERPGCQVGALCEMVTECTSRARATFVFECTQAGEYVQWKLRASDEGCDKPWAQCSREGQAGTLTCTDSKWLFGGLGSNPPVPCPRTLPEEGSSCRPASFWSGDPQACGYPCAEGGWTVIGCRPTGSVKPTGVAWKSDGACAKRGASTGN